MASSTTALGLDDLLHGVGYAIARAGNVVTLAEQYA
jgi:hypothetical protein